MKVRLQSRAAELAELLVLAAFGEKDEVVVGVEQGKRFADAGHEFDGMVEDEILPLSDLRFEVDNAEGVDDFVEGLAEGVAAVAGNFDVSLFGFPERLLGTGGCDPVCREGGDELGDNALVVDIILPECVVGVNEQYARG